MTAEEAAEELITTFNHRHRRPRPTFSEERSNMQHSNPQEVAEEKMKDVCDKDRKPLKSSSEISLIYLCLLLNTEHQV